MQRDLFGGPDAYGQITGTPEQERDKAIARVAAAAPEGWVDDAIRAIRHVALNHRLISSDDVWPLVVTPPEPRAMGAAFQEAARRGVIRKTDRVIASRRPECHGRPIAVWVVCE
jgi:hypothetical protein